MKGSWANLQAQDHEQTEKQISREGKQISRVLQLLSCGHFQHRGRVSWFSGQFLYPGSQTGADDVPSLLLDCESFTDTVLCLGQWTLQAKRGGCCRHQFSPVGSGREPGLLPAWGTRCILSQAFFLIGQVHLLCSSVGDLQRGDHRGQVKFSPRLMDVTWLLSTQACYVPDEGAEGAPELRQSVEASSR